ESESEKRSLTSSTTATFAARVSDIAHPLPKSLTHTKEFQTKSETDPEGSPARAKIVLHLNATQRSSVSVSIVIVRLSNECQYTNQIF
ncbi:MAG TPA: hypothetical protein DCQ88_05490, partial [Acidimicrobiaceae bacterium]|nr:hypothetical protein [Acidimicrobiaceae bacterium]